MTTLAIIGGGAAGMMASVFAARRGLGVHVYEKNEKLGKKLYITGKGRCNLTNACDMEELLASVKSNPKFLYSAFYGFTNQDTMNFFEQEGLRIKTERGNRVFPESDRSADVLDTLRRAMKQAGVQVHLHTEVKRLSGEKGRFCLELSDDQMVWTDEVFVATGGISYASTGSTGDGYRIAEAFGLKVTDTCPSLVPFNIREEFVKELQGLSLKNISIRILDGKKVLYEEFGEMLFTHFGISGPLVLTASSVCGKKVREKELKLILDLKPALTAEQLDARVLREFEEAKNKQFKNVIPALFPAKLVPVMLKLSGVAPDKKVNEITREERGQLLRCIKELELTITGLRGYNEAIITKGGVSVKEIHPATMESKKVPGLYFIGEVLDLDAVTGGFNLQIAWSTAWAAAMSVGGQDEL
ncbi:MAG: NAD(P)/FAD-dependent oxidoreductase [Clostridiales bacterium]|nr:NAD(P)/FAD-dependent oxidoreductase [Clostridiales bacterium]